MHIIRNALGNIVCSQLLGQYKFIQYYSVMCGPKQFLVGQMCYATYAKHHA